MAVKIKYRVRCTDREVGEVSRIVADPIDKKISHLVVRAEEREWLVPFDRAMVNDETVLFNFPSDQLSQFPPLRREDFVELRDVEIAGLERRLEEVVPGELLVPLPAAEKDPSRRAFFIKLSNAIGVVLALPLVYPILRFLTQPLYRPFDNTWFKVARTAQFEEFDQPRLVKFKREIREGYLVREFNKSHWVVRASEGLREEIYSLRKRLYGDEAAKFHDERGNIIWENDPNSEFIVFAGKCPHLGCAYRWKENHKVHGRVFWCPCHLSIFAPDGEVLDGPAPRPLDLIPTRVDQSGLIEVIDAEYKAGKGEKVRIL